MSTAHEAMRRAKAAEWQLSFDTNYRSKLWTGDEAAAGCDRAMKMADIIFCPLGDFTVLYGEASADEAVAALAAKYPNTLIIMTLGKDGAQAMTSEGEVLRQPAILAGEVGTDRWWRRVCRWIHLCHASPWRRGLGSSLGRGDVVSQIHDSGGSASG